MVARTRRDPGRSCPTACLDGRTVDTGGRGRRSTPVHDGLLRLGAPEHLLRVPHVLDGGRNRRTTPTDDPPAPPTIGCVLIERLLPSAERAAEAFADDVDPSLYPEETEHVRSAVPTRRREFATVRRCAREALASLGVPPVPLLPGRCGAPRWPGGVVGSMTHCDGYRAAAVAPVGTVAGLGIDAEPHAPLPRDVYETVSLDVERSDIDALPDSPVRHWGPPALQCEGEHLQGVVPAHEPVVGLRRRAHHPGSSRFVQLAAAGAHAHDGPLRRRQLLQRVAGRQRHRRHGDRRACHGDLDEARCAAGRTLATALHQVVGRRRTEAGRARPPDGGRASPAGRLVHRSGPVGCRDQVRQLPGPGRERRARPLPLAPGRCPAQPSPAQDREWSDHPRT